MDENKRTFNDRWDDTKAWFGRTKEKVHVWIGKNKEVIRIAVPVLIGSGLELVKVLVKRNNLNKEEKLKTNFIYDPRKRHYYELKRKPKTKQWIEIDRRSDNGERLGDILQDMRLLK